MKKIKSLIGETFRDVKKHTKMYQKKSIDVTINGTYFTVKFCNTVFLMTSERRLKKLFFIIENTF